MRHSHGEPVPGPRPHLMKGQGPGTRGQVSPPVTALWWAPGGLSPCPGSPRTPTPTSTASGDPAPPGSKVHLQSPAILHPEGRRSDKVRMGLEAAGGGRQPSVQVTPGLDSDLGVAQEGEGECSPGPGPGGQFHAHSRVCTGSRETVTVSDSCTRDPGRGGSPERSPVCILRCTFRWCDVRKVFPQYGQSFMAEPRLRSRSSAGGCTPAALPASSPRSAAGETLARHFSARQKLFAPKLLTPRKVKHVDTTPVCLVLSI